MTVLADSYTVTDLAREVRAGQRGIPDARVRLGLPPEPDVRVDVLTRVAWAIVWRYCLLGGAAVTLAGGLPVARAHALLAVAVAAPAGVALGLWRRRTALASAWRMVVLATAVAVVPLPTMIVAAVALGVVDAVTARPHRVP